MAEFDPDAYLAKEDKKTGFDPDAYLAKTQPTTTALKEQGKAFASLGDTALNFITGGLDMAAYPLARAYYGTIGGLPADQAAAKAQQETTSPKDVLGRAFGYTGQPSYENNPLRQLGNYAGQAIGENVVQPLAQATGLPESDVGNMVNWGTVAAGAVAPKVMAPVYNTGKNIVRGAADVAGGAYGAATGKIAAPGAVPEPWQTRSVRQPVSSTYYTPEDIAAWRAGEIPTSSLQAQPIQNLGPEAIKALGKTEGNIPYAGQGMRALGEQIGETYRNPLNVLTDVGLDLATSGGIPTAARLGYKGYKGYQGVKAANTLERAGFTPMYPEETAALQAGKPHPSDINGPIAPPQSMAAQTPAAQAAMATTQRMAKPTPQPQQQQQPPAPSIFEKPLKPAPQPKPNTSGYATPDEMAAALVAKGLHPYDIKQLVKREFNVDVVVPEPVVKAPEPKPQPVDRSKLPKTAEEIEAENALMDLINQKRGVVTGDPAANRENFLRRVDETVPQLKQAREENKQTYGDRAAVFNEQAGKGFMPNPKDDITHITAVRHMINQTSQVGVKQANKTVSVSKSAYNDLADQAGITLDWTTAPKIEGMKVGDARTAMSKWMFDSMDKQVPELGLTARKESMRSQQKRAEAELGLTNEKPAEVNRPINNALQAALDKARANKGKPPGAMEMITNEPDAIKKINNEPWLSRDDFNQEVFMKELGKGSDKEFIAKMRSPEGDIIRAVDKELDSEMVKYPDNSGFLVRKDLEMPNTVDYSIFNNDGTRYEITKINDDIRKITLHKGDEIIADFVKPLGGKNGFWAVMDRGPEGGGQMIYKSDIKFSKDPQTRKLHKELPKIDFNSVVDEQLARAQEVKGK